MLRGLLQQQDVPLSRTPQAVVSPPVTQRVKATDLGCHGRSHGAVWRYLYLVCTQAAAREAERETRHRAEAERIRREAAEAAAEKQRVRHLKLARPVVVLQQAPFLCNASVSRTRPASGAVVLSNKHS